MYRALDAEEIVATIERLSRRIGERFPASGLCGVSEELLQIARHAGDRAAAINRPQVLIRAVVYIVIALIIASLTFALATAEVPAGVPGLAEMVQVIEAGINDVVLIGAAIFFLITFENRLKRGRALRAIHELRSIAHVIDMHQLTKDPAAILTAATDTDSSPIRKLTRYEINRYLDYCSELLSLTGKLAALYVQNFNDGTALTAVNEIESLTTALSRKIWQKIMILHSFDEEDVASPPRSPPLSP